MCCADAPLVADVFDLGGVKAFDAGLEVGHLPVLDCPEVMYIAKEEDVESAVQKLEGERVLGLDAEWNVYLEKLPSGAVVSTRPPGNIATLQLSSATVAAVFHISAMGGVPARLKALLNDPEVVKVGVNVQGDCTRLLNQWSVRVLNIEDCATLARSQNVTVHDQSSYDLQFLVRRLLRKHLAKVWARGDGA